MVLDSDRISCAPEEYENFHKDLFRTISKYLVITEDNFKIDIHRTHILISFSGEKN